MGKDVTVGMCVNGDRNGTFLVAELCSALVDGGEECKAAREEVKGWFTADSRKQIEDGDAKGKKVLLDKITLL